MSDDETVDELAVLADELVEQAADIRRQWGELAAALGVAVDDDEPAATSSDDENPARLVALDMLLSGRRREEIVEHLRRTFSTAEAEAVVDDVYREYGV